MFKFNFKKVQVPAFYFAVAYTLMIVWIFAGPKIDLGVLTPRGFTLGIDFKGGLVHQVSVYSGIPQEEIRKYAEESALGNEIQKVLIDDKKKIGKQDTYIIKATISKEEQKEIDSNPSLTQAQVYSRKIQSLYTKIREAHGDTYILTGEELKNANVLFPNVITGEKTEERNDNQRVLQNVVKDSENVISPSYSKGLRFQAILLVLFVLVIMAIYITFRFEFIYGIGAIVSLAHDAICVLGFVSFFNVEFDYNIIAAILFILGYSINDTIVIFDRIRENNQKLKELPYPEIVNISVNQTLGRSIITSFTTFMAAMALVIWGGARIEGFSRSIAIGIFFGTYSSIFVASPVVLLWYKYVVNRKTKKGEAPVKVTAQVAVENTVPGQTGTEAPSAAIDGSAQSTSVQLSKKQLKKLFGKK
jgi:preprotein translocase SecF subunit